MRISSLNSCKVGAFITLAVQIRKQPPAVKSLTRGPSGVRDGLSSEPGGLTATPELAVTTQHFCHPVRGNPSPHF